MSINQKLNVRHLLYNKKGNYQALSTTKLILKKIFFFSLFFYYLAVKKNTFESVLISSNEVDETGAYYTE